MINRLMLRVLCGLFAATSLIAPTFAASADAKRRNIIMILTGPPFAG